MKYEDIFKEWSVDGAIDLTQISRASAEIPKLQNKYLKWYTEEKLRLLKLKSDYKVLVKLKTDYYMGNMDSEDLKKHKWDPQPLKILRQDIPMHIESDSDIVTLSLNIGMQELAVEYLENIIRHINNRNFVIKNIIERDRFENGG